MYQGGLRVAHSGWVDDHVRGADVVVLEQHLLPGPAAVARSIDAPIGTWSVRKAERGNEDRVGVAGIDGDARNLPRRREADVRPGLARIGGLVHPITDRDRIPHVALTGADVDRARRGGRYGDGAD
jgi:hypothetical protein